MIEEASQFVLVIVWALILAYFLGGYLTRLITGRPRMFETFLSRIERPVFRIMGIDPTRSMTWKEYLFALLSMNALVGLFSFVVLLAQGVLPLNPTGVPGTSRDLVRDEHGPATLRRRGIPLPVLPAQPDGPDVHRTGDRDRRRHRVHPRPADIHGEDRQLLRGPDTGRPHDPFARVRRRRDPPQLPRGPADLERPPDDRIVRRGVPERPDRARGLLGIDQDVRPKRRRVLRRELGPSVREPQRRHEPARGHLPPGGAALVPHGLRESARPRSRPRVPRGHLGLFLPALRVRAPWRRRADRTGDAVRRVR